MDKVIPKIIRDPQNKLQVVHRHFYWIDVVLSMYPKVFMSPMREITGYGQTKSA